MRKRFISALLSLFVTVAAVAPFPAAANPALGAAASVVLTGAAAYIAGGNYTWATSDSQADFVESLAGLWSGYAADTGAGNPEDYREFVTFTSGGTWVIGKTLALQYKAFTHWLSERHNVATGAGTYFIEMPGLFINGATVYVVPDGWYTGFTLPSGLRISANGYGGGSITGRLLMFRSDRTYNGSQYPTAIYMVSAAHFVSPVQFHLDFNGSTSGFVLSESSNKITVDGQLYYMAWISYVEERYGFLPLGPDVGAAGPFTSAESGGLALSTEGAVARPNADDMADDDVLTIGGIVGTGEQVGSLDGLADITLAQAISGELTPTLTIEAASDIPPAPPALGDYNLSDLGDAMQGVFPFCIPWDLRDLLAGFYSPTAPEPIEIDLFVPLQDKVDFEGSTAFCLDPDVEPWPTIGAISRWGCLIGFGFSLLWATKRLIWTTGG